MTVADARSHVVVAGRFRRQLAWTGALTLLFVASMALPSYVFFSVPTDYTVLHTVLEFTSMAISLMIVALAWNLRVLQLNSQILTIGFFSMGVLLVDLAHALTFVGMPHLVTESSTQKTIPFWLAGRAIAAIGFLVLALVPIRHWSPRIWFPGLAIIAVACAAIWWVGLYRPEWFPTFFIPGEGVTTVKRLAEYLLAGLYALAAFLLARRSRREADDQLAWLAVAAWILALSELYFTLFVDVTDVYNLLGHLFKVTAYVMVYRAVFVAGVRQPRLQLAQEGALMRSLIDSIPDLISYTDRGGKLLGANRAFSTRIGVKPTDVVGRSPVDMLWSSGQGRSALPRMSDSDQRYEEILHDPDGMTHYFDTLLTPYFAEDGERLGVIEVSRDMTAQRAADARIRHLALFDHLTGLPNRAMMGDHAAESFADPANRTQAVIYLDLDDFKTTNDTVGHDVGDLIIIETAKRLSEAAGPEVFLCRLGGDEFAVLSPRCDLDGAAALTQGLLEAIDRPYLIDQYDLSLTASAGIAMYPTDGTVFDELASRADAAMYAAKDDGHNAYRFFSGDMLLRSKRQLELLAALRRAIKNDELVLHYQPQWSLTDEAIVGVEALVRWQHPELGLLQPAEFIGLAEESGLIMPIGEWVMQRAMADAVGWPESAGGPVTVAVNMSAVEFLQTGLVLRIQRDLLRSGLPPGRLEIEITESVAMANPEKAAVQLERLHEMGVSLSIDDFGTGYSSMAYLRRFHVNTLKIDRSFVEDLGHDADDEAIVSAIVEMSRALRCTTVAEGVETHEQLHFLRAHGCDVAQGYLLGRPVPADEIVALITSPGTRDDVVAQ